MPTIADILDRCIAASPDDGELGATVIRVLRAPGPESAGEAADDDLDLDALFAVSEDDDESDTWWEEPDPRDLQGARWLLAVGECG
jgi:hypothetical protein